MRLSTSLRSSSAARPDASDTETSSLPPAMRRLALSNLFAHSAEQVGLATSPLIAVLILNAGASATALLQAMQTLPFLLFAIPAGLLADRRSRSDVLVGGEIVRAGSLVTILVLLATDRLTLPLLAILGFLGSAGTIAYSVAIPSLVAMLVGGSRLPAANARIELIRSVAFVAGPAIAGSLVAWIEPAAAYAFAVTSSLVAVVALRGIRDPRQTSPSRNHPLADIHDGARFAFGHPLLRPVLLTAVLFNIAWFCLQGVYVAYAIDRLGMTSSQVGVTLAAYGVGMLAGALSAQRIMAALSFGRVIAIGPLAGVISSVLMAATLLVPAMSLALTGFFLLGAGPIIWTISSTTLRQAVTPQEMLGRVSALVVTATAGARPIGAGLGALVALTLGVEWCLIAALAGFAAQALVIVSSPVVRLAAQPASIDHELA